MRSFLGEELLLTDLSLDSLLLQILNIRYTPKKEKKYYSVIRLQISVPMWGPGTSSLESFETWTKYLAAPLGTIFPELRTDTMASQTPSIPSGVIKSGCKL